MTISPLHAESSDRPTKIIAVSDKEGTGIVNIPFFGKPISLPHLTRVLLTIRAIVPFDKSGIDLLAHFGLGE